MVNRLRCNAFLPVIFAGMILAGCRPGVVAPSATSTQPATRASGPMPPTEMPLPTVEAVTETASPPGLTPSAVTTSTIVGIDPGLQLTFVSDRSGQYGVYALDVKCLEAAGPCLEKPQLLFSWGERISAIDWSPDGKRLVLESNGQLHVVDWNGENVIQLISSPGSAAWPQWSSDGTKIAFIFSAAQPGSDVLGPHQIQVYDLNLGQVAPVLGGVYEPSRITWLSGEGMAYIAKVAEVDLTEFINIAQSDGTVIKQLPENASDYNHLLDLSVSPDDEQLAFVGEINPPTGKTARDVYVVNIDGKGLVDLTKGEGNNYSPAWSPLGDWIAFESNRNGDYNVYITRPDGARLVQVTQTSSEDIAPAWRAVR